MNTTDIRKAFILQGYTGIGLEKSNQEDQLEKGGKRATIGEVRTWDGRKVVKHADGWVLLNEKSGRHILSLPGGKEVPAEEHHVSHAREHIAKHEKGQGQNNDSFDKTMKHLKENTKEENIGYSHTIGGSTRYSKPDESKEQFHDRISHDVYQELSKQPETEEQVNVKRLGEVEPSNSEEYRQDLESIVDTVNSSGILPRDVKAKIVNGSSHYEYGSPEVDFPKVVFSEKISIKKPFKATREVTVHHGTIYDGEIFTSDWDNSLSKDICIKVGNLLGFTILDGDEILDTRTPDDKFNDELIPSLEEDARRTKVEKVDTEYSKKYKRQKYTSKPIKEGDTFLYPYSDKPGRVGVSKILENGTVLVGEYDWASVGDNYTRTGRNIFYPLKAAQSSFDELEEKKFEKKEDIKEITHNILHELKFDSIKGGDLKNNIAATELGRALKRLKDITRKYSVSDSSVGAGGFSGANSLSMRSSQSGTPVDIEFNGTSYGGSYGIDRPYLVGVKVGGALSHEKSEAIRQAASFLLSKYEFHIPEAKYHGGVDRRDGTNYSTVYLSSPVGEGSSYYKLPDHLVSTIRKEI